MTLPGLTVGQLEKAIEAATEVQKGPCKGGYRDEMSALNLKMTRHRAGNDMD